MSKVTFPPLDLNKYLMGRMSESDLMKDKTLFDNALDLIQKVNELMEAYGRYLDLSSGIRSKVDQKRIYDEKNAVRAKQKLPLLSIPYGSKHISCQAVDLKETDGKFKAWLKTAEAKVVYERLGLYFEDFSATPTWVHIQTVPPASKSRFFMP